jgi:hypothetical protein
MLSEASSVIMSLLSSKFLCAIIASAGMGPPADGPADPLLLGKAMLDVVPFVPLWQPTSRVGVLRADESCGNRFSLVDARTMSLL